MSRANIQGGLFQPLDFLPVCEPANDVSAH